MGCESLAQDLLMRKAHTSINQGLYAVHESATKFEKCSPNLDHCLTYRVNNFRFSSFGIQLWSDAVTVHVRFDGLDKTGSPNHPVATRLPMSLGERVYRGVDVLYGSPDILCGHHRAGMRLPENDCIETEGLTGARLEGIANGKYWFRLRL